MKKTIGPILVLALALLLPGCGDARTANVSPSSAALRSSAPSSARASLAASSTPVQALAVDPEGESEGEQEDDGIPPPVRGDMAVFEAWPDAVMLMGCVTAHGWMQKGRMPFEPTGKTLTEDFFGNPETPVVTTPVIDEGDRVTVYTRNGREGAAAIGEFEYGEGGNDLFILARLVPPLEFRGGLAIALQAGHDAMPRPTEFSKAKGRMTYSADIDGKGAVVCYEYLYVEANEGRAYDDGDGEQMYVYAFRKTVNGALVEEWEQEPGEDEVSWNSFDMFFIDVDGDGVMEEASTASGPAGYVYICPVLGEHSGRQYFMMDYGC